MKHTRLVTRVTGGHFPLLLRRQLASLLFRVKDGTEIVLELYQVPTRRSAAQNSAFHAMVVPWAKDEGHAVDDLKRDLLGTVFGWADSPLRETRVPLKAHTSLLTTEEFSELMTRTVEIAADTGYILQLPGEYQASKWMPEAMRP